MVSILSIRGKEGGGGRKYGWKIKHLDMKLKKILEPLGVSELKSLY